MSNDPAVTTQETVTKLPPEQDAAFKNLIAAAQQQFSSPGGLAGEFFPGETVAGFDPNQLAAQNQSIDFANQFGSQFQDQILQGLQFGLQGVLNPLDQPGIQDSLKFLQTNALQGLTEGILPQIRSGSIASGGFGGSRQGIAEGLAAGRTQQGVAGAQAGLINQAFQGGLGVFNNALNNAGNIFQSALAPQGILAGVGGQRQQQEQNLINAAQQRFNFESQVAPFLNLQRLQGLLTNNLGGTQTSTTTQDPGGNKILQGIGTAISLASLIPSGGATAPLLGSTFGGGGDLFGGIFGKTGIGSDVFGTGIGGKILTPGGG